MLVICNFNQSLLDSYLYTHPNRLILLVYVDDIVAAAPRILHHDSFFKNLPERFNTKKLEGIEKVLGIRITRNTAIRNIYLNQEKYISGILDRLRIMKAQHKKKAIPADDYEMPRAAEEDGTRIYVREYQQTIGSLMFEMILERPDIAFVLGS